MQKVRSYHPDQQGLYDFSNEHDACGVGLVANIDGRKTHKIVEQGVEVLKRLLHRGAAGSDPDTGDGAGILLQIPDEFFREACNLSFKLPAAGQYGVGMVFLPAEDELREKCIEAVEEAISSEKHRFLGWRDVPNNPGCLGKVARESCPVIKQFFVAAKRGNKDEDAFERKLYVMRRCIEKAVEEQTGVGEMFYIVSLSCRTIVYKGLLMAPQLPGFYEDVNNEKFKSALAIVHQRYSTNTFPTWPLAQPFRYLAHNGEINTLRGNCNQMRAREPHLESDLFGNDIKKIFPVISEGQSDSACLDNALELFHNAGRALSHSMLMLIPQAWGSQYHIGRDVRGFFEYNSALMEPWDGPAAVAFTDGRSVGALLDRNGLRPARYTITKDNFVVLASETGVLDIPDENVESRGRLGPGQILMIDLERQRVMSNNELKTHLARSKPYRRWVDENKISLHGLYDSVMPVKVGENLLQRQKLFGYTREDVNLIIKAMASLGHEPTGSMGNDAALAVLSEKPQLLYNYFKQLFAQVTNPPIDPIREELVMSLMTYIGNQGNTLSDSAINAHLVKLPHPILTDEDLKRLCTSKVKTFQAETLSIGFYSGDSGRSLRPALKALCRSAEKAVRNGKSVLVLSDRLLKEGQAPIPALLATAAVNAHLVKTGLRTSAGIVLETGEAREIMHFVLLLGYGATAINPYLALETVTHMALENRLDDISTVKATANYIKAVCKGILKVMSKMGISTLRSYRGAQVFEAIGLNNEIISEVFSGTASRIGGIGFEEVAQETNTRYLQAFKPRQDLPFLLESGGNYHYRQKGEQHLWTPETISLFQQAVRDNNADKYKKYAEYINNQEKRLCTLRGLFKFKKAKSIPLSEVEPAADIVRRFVSGAMSFGSISPEAHETIAIAMNRIGGMSNSGEGGEDPVRFKPLPNNDSKCSAIKQIASGRFGVTAEYLANARELQIKVAQGAKPGEGGQLPGHKVLPAIAKVRHSTPGVTLISPPPHHDIYSIEDLAELIYDLKLSNTGARVSVKLVSEVGVGTVAAGVAKGHADMVLVSGHDGGTGASPLTSIKHAGLPWELGLAETQQTLVLNQLRDRIRVQVDGQLKTGRDVIIGALLGAEEFGFATTVLVSVGCVMMRKCHSNTCPVGVATQDPVLRKFFQGKPEHVINFLMFIAEEVREYLAQLGLRSIDEAVGHSDLLETNEAIDFWKTRNLDFSKIFEQVEDKELPRRCVCSQDHGVDKAYDKVKLLDKILPSVESGKAIEINETVSNVDRAVGAMVSNVVAKKYGYAGLPEDTIKINFTGTAGQSFGAFLPNGVTFNLIGESNDYVGKSLSGGKIIIKPSDKVQYKPEDNTAAGNVLLYGATGGQFYVNGQVGERFAIRNSGATAVVEGSGDHCCEYMTGGRVVVLGQTGVNFGAGMSGGLAYVFDINGDFDLKCNLDMVDLESIDKAEDAAELRGLIEVHLENTGSPLAKRLLDDWESSLPLFVKVFPVEYRKALGLMNKEEEKVNSEEKATDEES
ncbi:MAG: glutamate synthase large subunit, partial [Lentisphaerae bacterium]|nr:glutamate synthase large subunit [Lentisphaerota bacterium]MCP4103195.1 glutamate synthase large subunit [Lentisphaerota bacterium]